VLWFCAKLLDNMLEIYIVIFDHGSPDFALLSMVFAIWYIVLEIFSEEIIFFKQVNAQFLLCIYLSFYLIVSKEICLFI
jgi:hypothetical protein